MTCSAPNLPLTPAAPPSVEVMHTREQMQALMPAWKRLFAAAHLPSPALHPQWCALWWDLYADAYAAGPQALRLLCFRHGGQLVGVLPLYLRQPHRLRDGGLRLGFIATGESETEEICPDYLDVLAEPAWEAPCAASAWEMLCQQAPCLYDRLELADMASDSSLGKWASLHAAQHNLEILPRGVCPIADLTGGFEAYLSRLSANTRQQSRRILRAAATAGVTFEMARDVTQADEFFQQMVALHQQRWQAAGQPGCFARPRFREFHRRLLAQWHSTGQALISRLSLQGVPLAVKYGFRSAAKYYFYQSGVSHESLPTLRSPGIASFLLLMRHLADHQVTTFDFLRGAANYKQRLATTTRPLVLVRHIRQTWRTNTGMIADISARVAHKVMRVMNHAAAPGHKTVPEAEVTTW